MADRPHRGGHGGHRGARSGGGRGGGRGGAAAAQSQGQQGQDKERPKKENILDLKKYMDKRITVKFNGGREGSFRLLVLPSPLSPSRHSPLYTFALRPSTCVIPFSQLCGRMRERNLTFACLPLV